ncbi:hypothetical protein [Nocardioides sp. YIM 152588]|uniref:hypothetical protein n=1 Tax=Nocardioides sp. YIM 152588 TaxID=3158259 RepID=UPI0032E44250
MTRNPLIVPAALAATAALVLGLTGPADAATARVTDPDDTAHGSDLLAVRIVNGENRLLVVTTHQNLRRSPSSGSSGTLYVDTDADDKGPEFVFVGGYFQGTDYVLLHTEGFGHKKWGDPVEGTYSMKLDYRHEKVRMRMSKDALDGAESVRIADRVAGTRSDGTSTGLVDWLGEPRSFTDWVDEG